jgi:hypothetical protein
MESGGTGGGGDNFNTDWVCFKGVSDYKTLRSISENPRHKDAINLLRAISHPPGVLSSNLSNSASSYITDIDN